MALNRSAKATSGRERCHARLSWLLLSHPQLGQVGADRGENASQAARRRDHPEFVRAAGAVLHDRRSRIATGVDLDGVDRDAGGFDIGAGAGAIAG